MKRNTRTKIAVVASIKADKRKSRGEARGTDARPSCKAVLRSTDTLKF